MPPPLPMPTTIPPARTRVLSRTQDSELRNLVDIVNYIAALEAVSASFSNPHTFAGTSSYNKQK